VPCCIPYHAVTTTTREVLFIYPVHRATGGGSRGAEELALLEALSICHSLRCPDLAAWDPTTVSGRLTAQTDGNMQADRLTGNVQAPFLCAWLVTYACVGMPQCVEQLGQADERRQQHRRQLCSRRWQLRHIPARHRGQRQCRPGVCMRRGACPPHVAAAAVLRPCWVCLLWQDACGGGGGDTGRCR
jgi:hypothetical protein